MWGQNPVLSASRCRVLAAAGSSQLGDRTSFVDTSGSAVAVPGTGHISGTAAARGGLDSTTASHDRQLLRSLRRPPLHHERIRHDTQLTYNRAFSTSRPRRHQPRLDRRGSRLRRRPHTWRGELGDLDRHRIEPVGGLQIRIGHASTVEHQPSPGRRRAPRFRRHVHAAASSSSPDGFRLIPSSKLNSTP